MNRRSPHKAGPPEGPEQLTGAVEAPAESLESCSAAAVLPAPSETEAELSPNADAAPESEQLVETRFEPPSPLDESVSVSSSTVGPRQEGEPPRRTQTPSPQGDLVEDTGPLSTVPGFLQPYLYSSPTELPERPLLSGTASMRSMRSMHGSLTPYFDFDDSARSDDVQDKLIGEILRVTNRLSTAQIDEILAHQAERKQKFGESAVALGMVEREDVLWALSQQFQYAYTPVDANDNFSNELVVACEPFSKAAEVFREMRTQLLMNVLDGGGRRALSVVSAGVGEGKTFFAANLAVAFSQLGARTLLIDADMRTPRLHKVFGVDSANGLSAVLSGRAQVSVVRPIASLPSLYLLPVGAPPPNPSELLQRPGFAMMIKGALRSFEHVIVDTPAAQLGPDARVISSRCGAALAIGRKHRTPLGKLQALIDQIGKHTERFAGVVMNEY